MNTRDEYINLVQSNDATLRRDFGVKSLRLFGSVAHGDNRPDSDVDVCVEMEPKMMLVIRLKKYLEQLFQASVDLVRMRPTLNPYLKNEIGHDGILVLKQPSGLGNTAADRHGRRRTIKTLQMMQHRGKWNLSFALAEAIGQRNSAFENFNSKSANRRSQITPPYVVKCCKLTYYENYKGWMRERPAFACFV